MKDRKGFFPVIGRELSRIASRPLYIVLMIVLPLVVFITIGLIFIRGVPRDLPVAVLDQDNSVTSRKIIRLIDSTPSAMVAERVNDISQGKDLILGGDCYALIVLPKDMEKDLVRGRAPGIINYYNNEFLLAGSLIYRDIATVIRTVSSGISIQTYQKKGKSFMESMALSQVIRVDSQVLFNPFLNYVYFMVASILPAMLQMFILLCVVVSFGTELRYGTGRELIERAGGSFLKAISGKLFPYAVNFIILDLLMNLYIAAIGTPLRGNIPFLILSSIIFVLAYQSVGLVIIALFPNFRMGLSVVAFYSTTAFAFVGITFPRIGMTLPAKLWSGILPLTYYTKIFIDQAMRGAPLEVSYVSFCVLFLFIFIPVVVFYPRVGKILMNEKYWGRI